MLRLLALIPLGALNALIGFPLDEPNDPNEAGANEAGENALLSELPDMAAIGDSADIAPIGLENDIPG